MKAMTILLNLMQQTKMKDLPKEVQKQEIDKIVRRAALNRILQNKKTGEKNLSQLTTPELTQAIKELKEENQ